MNHEEASPHPQPPTDPERIEEHLQAGAPSGLAAGPLRMGIAGLLAGVLIWSLVQGNYPWFYPEEVAFKNEESPSRAELEQLARTESAASTKNAVVLGLAMGFLATLAFALAECLSQGATGRTLLRTGIAIVLGAGLGVAGGYLCVEFQQAYPHGGELDPIQRTIGIQCVLWLTLACGVGTGLALFAGSARLALATALQALLAAALFVLIYVPVASLAFPLDDANNTTPQSSGNIAVWAIGAFLLIGVMLGMSRVRVKKQTDSEG
jgi:hypothetical protein